MDGAYVTVFEVSYWSNGTLLLSFASLVIGVGVTAGIVSGKFKMERVNRYLALLLWSTPWIGMATFWMARTAWNASEFRAALEEGTCQIAEGPVVVVRASSKADQLQIGGTLLKVNHAVLGLSYRKTVAHGGVLRDGVQARVSYFRGQILKVEVLR